MAPVRQAQPPSPTATSPFRCWPIAISLLLLAACGSGDAGRDGAEEAVAAASTCLECEAPSELADDECDGVTGIAMRPADVAVTVGEAMAVPVVGRRDQGDDQPLAGSALTSSDPAVAAVGADGSVRGLRPGSVELKARACTREHTQTLAVLPSLTERKGQVCGALAGEIAERQRDEPACFAAPATVAADCAGLAADRDAALAAHAQCLADSPGSACTDAALRFDATSDRLLECRLGGALPAACGPARGVVASACAALRELGCERAAETPAACR